MANIEIYGPFAHDDIWVYARRLAASSGESLPKRDNFFSALAKVPGVTRISDTWVPITTKAGCPKNKTTAYVIQSPATLKVAPMSAVQKTRAA